MLTTDKARLLLRIDEEDMSDDELQQYIDYFSQTTLARIGVSAQQDAEVLNNPIFEEAVMSAIACRLSLTDIDIIHSPSDYDVGDTSESFRNTSLGNYGSIPSWCDLYNNLLDSLSSNYRQLQNIQVFRRRGMSVRRKWYRDLY